MFSLIFFRLWYLQVLSGEQYVQQANANRRPGLNHFGLHVENLKATVATLKERGVTVDEVRVRPGAAPVRPSRRQR